MARKIPCPKCGEPNYESSPACWACGAPMKGPRAAAPDADSGVAQAETLLDAAPAAKAEPEIAPTPPAEPPTPAPPPDPETAPLEALLDAVPEAMEPGAPPPSPGPPASPPGPKPAELEAQALRDKEYVTPPVNVEDRPKSIGQWISYLIQMIGASVSAFKGALDDYDSRRGRKSGAMSSYGCLVTAITVALCIALIVWMVSHFAGSPMP